MEDFAGGDPTSTLAIWHPGIRWYSVGQSPVAGKYVGQEATLGYLAELGRLSRNTFRSAILEVRPMFGNTYVARFRHRAAVDDARLDTLSSLIIDGEDDRVVSVVEVHHDEAAWDTFWTAAAASDAGRRDATPLTRETTEARS